jgi:hypothetical protein
MKVFLSWSGPRSRAVAEALNDWLRRVIQAVKPFYSPEIEKGARWSSEVDDALEGTRFGIICLTPDNLKSVWIHYEAGALSKTKDALIWTFLHGLTPGDVPPPLGKFQHTVAEKEDVLRLLKTINGRLADVGSEPLQDRLLEENFELFWPRLEESLSKAERLSDAATPQTREGAAIGLRDEGAKLEEILELVRSQERRLSGLEDRLPTLQPSVVTAKGRIDNSYYSYIYIPVQKDSVADAEAIARELVTTLEFLEPDARVTIEDVVTLPTVHVHFAHPRSRTRIGYLLELAGKNVNYDIKSWGGAMV